MPEKPLYLKALYDELANLQQRVLKVQSAIRDLESDSNFTPVPAEDSLVFPHKKLIKNIVLLLANHKDPMTVSEIYATLKKHGVKIGNVADQERQMRAIRIAVGSNKSRVKIDKSTDLVSLARRGK